MTSSLQEMVEMSTSSQLIELLHAITQLPSCCVRWSQTIPWGPASPGTWYTTMTFNGGHWMKWPNGRILGSVCINKKINYTFKNILSVFISYFLSYFLLYIYWPATYFNKIPPPNGNFDLILTSSIQLRNIYFHPHPSTIITLAPSPILAFTLPYLYRLFPNNLKTTFPALNFHRPIKYIYIRTPWYCKTTEEIK